MDPTAAAAIDALNRVYGTHPSYRALHAKRTVLSGTFIAAPHAARLTRAAHFQGGPIPATVRVSNASGNPAAPDWRPDVRGLAVKLELPDGPAIDFVTTTMPRSPANTVSAFLELLEARDAGVASLYRAPRFLTRHPESIPALAATLPTMAPPVSYAGVRYHGLHAFMWLDDAGGERYVRYSFEPAEPTGADTPWQARGHGREYLQREIVDRISRREVMFAFVVQIAEPGDPVDDATARWPPRRRRVQVGTLELLGPDPGREPEGEVLVFDPTRVTDGIELSDDPVLRYRAAAYSESVARRVGA